MEIKVLKLEQIIAKIEQEKLASIENSVKGPSATVPPSGGGFSEVPSALIQQLESQQEKIDELIKQLE